MRRVGKQRCGFVGNELLIVFVIFSLFCLVLAVSLGGAFKLAWYWRALLGFSFFGLGVGWFFAYCSTHERRKKQVAEAEAKREAPSPDHEGASRFGPHNEASTDVDYILLVGRPRESLKVAAGFLAASGASVTVVDDGGEAWSIIEKAPPRILFLDPLLTTIDGFEILERLWHKYPDGPTQIIFATTMTDDGVPSRSWSSPVANYVMGPYNPWHVLFAVEQLLYRNVTMNEEAAAQLQRIRGRG